MKHSPSYQEALRSYRTQKSPTLANSRVFGSFTNGNEEFAQEPTYRDQLVQGPRGSEGSPSSHSLSDEEHSDNAVHRLEQSM